MERRKYFNILVAFVGSSMVGLAPLFVRLTEQGAIGAGFYRILFALPFLFLWMRREGAFTLGKRDVALLTLYGALFALDLTFWNLSLRMTKVLNASLFNNFAALFVPILAWMFLRERPRKELIAGLVCALIGSGLIMGGGIDISRSTAQGDGLAILSALCYAGYLLIIKDLRQRLGAGTTLFFGGLVATLAFYLLSLTQGGLSLPTSWKEGGWLLAFALCSQIAGQGLIALSLRRLNASVVGLILLSQPLISTLVGCAVFGESVSYLTAIGALVILSGLYLAPRNA